MRVKYAYPHIRWRMVNVAVVAAILTIAGFMAYRHQRLGSTPKAVNALNLKRPAILVAAMPKPAGAPFTRIRVAENEVDYIRDDVTIRYFNHEPVGYNEVHFGEDVTVRYFRTPTPGRPADFR